MTCADFGQLRFSPAISGRLPAICGLGMGRDADLSFRYSFDITVILLGCVICVIINSYAES